MQVGLYYMLPSARLSLCVDVVLMDVAYFTMDDTEKQLYYLLGFYEKTVESPLLLAFDVSLFLANIELLSLSGEFLASGLVHLSIGAASST